ncbi:Hypothetical_protein [Hexamita inflata]|uniref:Hypothetical_protein n=1 Tax=Hexamita inflata TaxID=28002 RepID=A0AA86P351_9EUKA|nr:Hypothetical protein HINF_LOCUS18471 [Hexamita inflata]
MSSELPYECDTSKYYQPYIINGVCVCNDNLVEFNNYCQCNEELGFLPFQQNDNCECSQTNGFLFLSANKKRCGPCDERNGQFLVNGECVCAENYRTLRVNPLQCSKCARNQYLVNNTCYCSQTQTEGECQQKNSVSLQFFGILSVFIGIILVAIVVIRNQINKNKKYKKKSLTKQQIKLNQQTQVQKQIKKRNRNSRTAVLRSNIIVDRIL